MIGANSKLNQPRYRSLKGIMQAKKKTIELRTVELTEAKLTLEQLNYPPAKGGGKIFTNGVEAVPELVKLLREEKIAKKIRQEIDKWETFWLSPKMPAVN